MKIVKTRLNPLYDQYSNDENRLTHAFLHTIGSSNQLFSKFIKKFIDPHLSFSGRTFEISTQKVPFSHGDEDPEQVESIPDAWIIDESNSLGVAIEVKDKKNNLNFRQLKSHANRIRKYKHQHLLVITSDLQKPKQIIKVQKDEKAKLNVVWLSWDTIYRWLNNLIIKTAKITTKESFLITSMLAYLERRREVLGFQGIFFREGFDTIEAKEILNSEMEELYPTIKKHYKELLKRRPAITTFSSESVWDCFGVTEGFTKDLHITLSIHEKYHDISLVVPNSAKSPWRRLKKVFSDDELEARLFLILKSVRKKVPHLFLEFHQRHFIAQKKGVRDGFMEFNIDTLGIPFKTKKSKAKEFPVWLQAIKSAILNKRKINGQASFKARFYLEDTKAIDSPHFIETAKSTLNNFKPLYEFLKES